MSITRRLFLRHTAAVGAVAATVAAPAVADTVQTADPAHAHWEAFIASLGDRVPAGARLQVFGNATTVRVEIMVRAIEQVHPKVALEVERSVDSYRLTPQGWERRDWR